MRQNAVSFIVLGLLGFVLGLGLFQFSGVLPTMRMLNSGSTAQGLVLFRRESVRYETSTSSSRRYRRSTCTLNYEFYVNGQRYTNTSIGEDTLCRYSSNSPITVHYDARNPDHNTVNTIDAYGMLVVIFAVITIGSAGAVAFGVFLLFQRRSPTY